MKNDLNCYCQRLGIPLPVYQTTVEGYAHALRFKSVVSVGKRNFTSSNTFATRKSAEQDAAKLALEHLLTEEDAKSTNLRVYLRKVVIFPFVVGLYFDNLSNRFSKCIRYITMYLYLLNQFLKLSSLNLMYKEQKGSNISMQ